MVFWINLHYSIAFDIYNYALYVSKKSNYVSLKILGMYDAYSYLPNYSLNYHLKRLTVLIHHHTLLGRNCHVFNIGIPIGPVTLFLEFFPRELTEMYKQ